MCVEKDEKKTREALKYSPGEESFDACHAFTDRDHPRDHVTTRATRLPTGTTPRDHVTACHALTDRDHPT